MSTLELKGGMLEAIMRVEDKSALEVLYKIIQEFVSRQLPQKDFWDELTPAQQAEVEEAHAESFDESNWVPHEVVIKKYEKWLKR